MWGADLVLSLDLVLCRCRTLSINPLRGRKKKGGTRQRCDKVGFGRGALANNILSGAAQYSQKVRAASRISTIDCVQCVWVTRSQKFGKCSPGSCHSSVLLPGLDGSCVMLYIQCVLLPCTYAAHFLL